MVLWIWESLHPKTLRFDESFSLSQFWMVKSGLKNFKSCSYIMCIDVGKVSFELNFFRLGGSKSTPGI